MPSTFGTERKKCPHNSQKYRCKTCAAQGKGGGGICVHNKQRYKCVPCGGASICEHGRERSQCVPCGGSSICEHKRRRAGCVECGGTNICRHGKQRKRCTECLALKVRATAPRLLLGLLRGGPAEWEGGEGGEAFSAIAAAPQQAEVEEWANEGAGAPAAAPATAGPQYAVRSRPGLRASKRTRKAVEAEAEAREDGEWLVLATIAAAPQQAEVEEWASEGAGSPAAAAAAAGPLYPAPSPLPSLRASKLPRSAAVAEGEGKGAPSPAPTVAIPLELAPAFAAFLCSQAALAWRNPRSQGASAPTRA
jgi:hypothetical protein